MWTNKTIVLFLIVPVCRCVLAARTHWLNHLFTQSSLFGDGAEIVLAYAAEGAYPVGGDVLESSAGGNAAVGVAFGRVVDVTADVANVLFHCFEF